MSRRGEQQDWSFVGCRAPVGSPLRPQPAAAAHSDPNLTRPSRQPRACAARRRCCRGLQGEYMQIKTLKLDQQFDAGAEATYALDGRGLPRRISPLTAALTLLPHPNPRALGADRTFSRASTSTSTATQVGSSRCSAALLSETRGLGAWSSFCCSLKPQPLAPSRPRAQL